MTPVLRPVGAAAVLLELAPGQVDGWRAEVERLVAQGRLPRPVDVVPGACTLLLDGVPLAAAARALADVGAASAAAPADGPLVEVPVTYDGEDLAAVADLLGTDVAGVVARHTATTFRVAFCGFAPGFPYCTGLEVDVPRRSSPRPRVPAGSVALAGRYCGIYPTASPGGWQLLGRTAVRLFDPDRDPPALLPPGTQVRFVDREAPPPSPLRPPSAVSTGRALTVVRAGARTTVQDLGRPGSAHLGVPRSGALDPSAARLANRLVGNADDAAVLETTATGVALRTARATTLAVTGATAPVTVDGRGADSGAPLAVPAGAVVDVGAASAGVRSYVAVAGGLAVAPVLGSRATDTLSGLGPAPLADGDVLPVGPFPGPPAGVDVVAVPLPREPLVLRLLAGPRADRVDLSPLAGATYTVSPLSDRVGARLQGPVLAARVQGELESEGIVLGAVQVPPDGQPVVLLADHPTTGGYPVVGVVDAAGVAALAQARPGTAVRLVPEGEGWPRRARGRGTA